MKEVIEKAKEILDKNGLLNLDMLMKEFNITRSCAGWVIKKLMRDKIIVETDIFGVYLPYKELKLDEIVEILRKKDLIKNMKEILEAINNSSRLIKTEEIYKKLGKSEAWAIWNLTRCINFGLVEKKFHGFYKITDKGMELLKILNSIGG